MENPFKDYGVDPDLFSEICYKLSLGKRTRVDEGRGLVGSSYTGDIGGVPLVHRNVKDGSNG